VKEPLVLLHGFTGCAATWDRLIPLLEQDHEILALTLVGHYGGPPVPEGMTNPITAMADEIERAMDEAGHERAHIVGNSLGGWLAFEMGARGRALSVVAFSPAMGWETDEPPAHTRRMFIRMHRAAPYVPRVAKFLSRRPGLRRLAFRDVASRAERMSPREAYDLMMGTTGCTMFEPFLEFMESGEYRSSWPEDLGVPTRIAWSELDRTLPLETCTGWYRSALPDAEWVVLPGLGHLPQHDDPELVAKTILEVTNRQAAPATAAAARS
jgi:pimeloyl-ACP methyl ester carboxylesterase